MIQGDTAKSLNDTVGQEDGVDVSTRGDSQVVVSQDDSEDGPLDLKPFFKQSPNVRKTNKGGWYLIVPIRRYTYRNAESAKTASGMSKRMYNELRSAPTNTTLVSDYLYENRQVSPIPELNYEPKSNTITKLPNPVRRSSSVYIAFRTVSNTSAPNSWIINREKATEDNLSPQIREIIEEVKKRNMRQ